MGFLRCVSVAVAALAVFSTPAAVRGAANVVLLDDLKDAGTFVDQIALVDGKQAISQAEQVFSEDSDPAACALYVTTDNYPVVNKGSYIIATVLDQYGMPLEGAWLTFESSDLPDVGVTVGQTGPSGQFGIQTNSDHVRQETWIVSLFKTDPSGGSVAPNRRLLTNIVNPLPIVIQTVTLTWQQSCSVVGDPQFTGLLGQSYQVHGTDNTIYNIISTPLFQYNALFSYLDHGECRKGTPCFSHPGNYFGAVGAAVRDAATGKIDEVQIIAGGVAEGLRVMLNNETVAVGAVDVMLGGGLYKLSVPSAFEAVLESSEFSLRIANSDNFLNQDVSLGVTTLSAIGAYKAALKSGKSTTAKVLELLSALPHGLLGQTWSERVFANRWKHIEGLLFDYVVSDGMFGTTFRFNRF